MGPKNIPYTSGFKEQGIETHLRHVTKVIGGAGYVGRKERNHHLCSKQTNVPSSKVCGISPPGDLYLLAGSKHSISILLSNTF